MATAETIIKQKLDRRDKKIAERCKLMYRRLTFGPYAASGTPDQLKHWGTAGIFVEVKRDGKKPTKLQQHKLEEAIRHGTPAIAVCGEEGLETYHQDLAEQFTPEAVEARIQQYREDCAKLYETLLEMN